MDDELMSPVGPKELAAGRLRGRLQMRAEDFLAIVIVGSVTIARFGFGVAMTGLVRRLGIRGTS